MKTIFIEARSDIDIMPAVREAFRFLSPKSRVAIAGTIQHLHKLKEARKFLEDNHIKADIAGQVLGCRVPQIPSSAEQILYIGSGKFHPIGIFLKTRKDVIAADPLTSSVSKVTAKDVEALEKRRKGALLRFLTSDRIGILVSTKQGQTDVQGGRKKIEALKKKYKDKKFYMYAFYTLQASYLDNFPFIQCWVNTACPRIFEDFSKGMVNLEDLQL
ncbi:MAG: diphthamide synthesis protein [Candidatus Woesearchaeota archaeon]|nr:diphthamide synthesis protein [Candidatus Woesearchaeota archaeon]